MTVDEELSLLEDNLRKLKIEYDRYFNGGAQRPPTDVEWRVKSLLSRYSDGRRLNFSQRFRYNSLANRYAIYNDLWRQKLKIKEEGYRRPQDAVLGIVGLRGEEENLAASELDVRQHHHARAFSIRCSDPAQESEKVLALFHAMTEARKRAGAPTNMQFESFSEFVRQKTEQIRREHRCQLVEYSIDTRENQVRLKAKARN